MYSLNARGRCSALRVPRQPGTETVVACPCLKQLMSHVELVATFVHFPFPPCTLKAPPCLAPPQILHSKSHSLPSSPGLFTSYNSSLNLLPACFHPRSRPYVPFSLPNPISLRKNHSFLLSIKKFLPVFLTTHAPLPLSSPSWLPSHCFLLLKFFLLISVTLGRKFEDMILWSLRDGSASYLNSAACN